MDIIEKGYINLLSKFHTEQGVLRKMRRYMRHDERDEPKKAHEIKAYIDSIRSFETEATRKHLADGIVPILKDEMKILFEDLKLALEEDDKLIRDINELKTSLLRDLDRHKLDANLKEGNAAEGYKHMVTIQINEALKRFLANLQGEISASVGRESLTIDSIKLIKDHGAQMQVVDGEIQQSRKDLRSWQATTKGANRYAYFFKDNTQIQAIQHSGLFDEHSDKSLAGRLEATLNDLAKITQHIIIILEELRQQAQDLLDGKDGQVDNLRPISARKLKTPKVQGGLGFPLNVDLETKLKELLQWYKEEMDKYVSLLRLETSKVEHQMLKAA